MNQFRAWDRVNKKMLYSHKEFIISPRWGACTIQNNRIAKAKHLVLLEFTGKKDITGNKIWQGDLVSNGDVTFEVVKGYFDSNIEGEFLGFGLKPYPSFGRDNNIYIFDKSYKKQEIVGTIFEKQTNN